MGNCLFVEWTWYLRLKLDSGTPRSFHELRGKSNSSVEKNDVRCTSKQGTRRHDSFVPFIIISIGTSISGNGRNVLMGPTEMIHFANGFNA
eukprot:gene10252-biopygen2957